MFLHFIHKKVPCIVIRTYAKGTMGELKAKCLGWCCKKCGKVVVEKPLYYPDEEIKKMYPNYQVVEEL